MKKPLRLLYLRCWPFGAGFFARVRRNIAIIRSERTAEVDVSQANEIADPNDAVPTPALADAEVRGADMRVNIIDE